MTCALAPHTVTDSDNQRPCLGDFTTWLEPNIRPRRSVFYAQQLRDQMAHALNACDTCPVRSPCQRWALSDPDPCPWHTAGGLTSIDRRIIRIRQGRAA